MCLMLAGKGKMKVATAAATTSPTHGDTSTKCETTRKASSDQDFQVAEQVVDCDGGHVACY